MLTFDRHSLPDATLAARERCRDASIATRVKAGRIQIVRLTYSDNGTSKIAPVTDWLTMSDAIHALDAL